MKRDLSLSLDSSHVKVKPTESTDVKSIRNNSQIYKNKSVQIKKPRFTCPVSMEDRLAGAESHCYEAAVGSKPKSKRRIFTLSENKGKSVQLSRRENRNYSSDCKDLKNHKASPMGASSRHETKVFLNICFQE